MKRRRKYEFFHRTYTEIELWDAISELSDIRAEYTAFDAKEYPKYHACSVAIDAIRTIVKVDENEDRR